MAATAPGLTAEGTPARPIGAIVLAGGKSSRLGYDKALVLVNGESLVQWLPRLLLTFFRPVAVVVSAPDQYPVAFPQVVDAVPDAGPLAGIAAGLQFLATEAMFVCAVDMPLLRPALLRRLQAALDGYDLVLPERAGRLEPLCAIYAASCLPAVQRLLAGGRLRANGVAAEVHTRILTEAEWRDVDPEGDSFLNINTPTDLARLQARANEYGLDLAGAAPLLHGPA
jgi:molybdopterin-guanine dinucleotide biosynthesis protein A